MKKVIICDGDSWTAGHFVNPKLKKLFDRGELFEMDKRNDDYRLPKVWPYKLGKLLNSEVVNIACAGSSNDSIVKRTIENVLKYLKNYKPEELFVIVGWSSPERKDFYFKGDWNGGFAESWETMYPAELTLGFGKYKNTPLSEFYKLYLTYFWNEEEYIARYMEQNLLLHYFLKDKKIKHLFFNSFYESKFFLDGQLVNAMHEDIELVQEIYEKFNSKLITEDFKKINKNFFHDISFREMMVSKDSEFPWPEGVWDKVDGHHPSELAHEFWAEELNTKLKGKL